MFSTLRAAASSHRVLVASLSLLLVACSGRTEFQQVEPPPEEPIEESLPSPGSPELLDAGTPVEGPIVPMDPVATPEPAPEEPAPPAAPAEPPPPPPPTAPGFDYAASLTADFAYRDSLPQTEVPEAEWFDKSVYGPPAATYPEVQVPSGVTDELQWKRDRVIEVAKHFIGTPYAHLHIPDAGGLDCSNYTAWIYNYGFGIRFTSNTQKQANEAGRLLAPGEPLEKGDLIFIWNSSFTEIGHAAIYIDPEHLIDSTSSATPALVNVRDLKGWYKTRFAFARRIIE